MTQQTATSLHYPLAEDAADLDVAGVVANGLTCLTLPC